ncbi:MAG: peptidoglycan recognition family protein [Planctomycetota bacterium]
MDAPPDHHQPADVDLSRRAALARVAQAALLTGGLLPLGACSTVREPSRPASLGATIHRPGPVPDYTAPRAWTPLPETSNTQSIVDVLPRTRWAKGDPIPSRMSRMHPITRITVHHDGMNAFTSTSVDAAARRIDNIRRGHVGRGWGDIGYHYVIDPAGRVWSGRPLGWQGAHVKDHNVANVGICVLGNYERQHPNSAQLAAVDRTISGLMTAHSVSPSRVYTHRELRPTACPGRSLQTHMNELRRSRGALATT